MRLQSFRKKNNIKDTHILLISACLQEDKILCESLLRKWEELVDISDLDYSSSRIVPYFLNHLQKLGLVSVYDNRLKIIYKHWWLNSKHLNFELHKITNELSERGKKQVLYKGSSIKDHYENPDLRTMSDLDLLIRVKDVTEVIQILENLGYAHVNALKHISGTARAIYLDFFHSTNFIHKTNGTKIDLHWEVGSNCTHNLTQSFWDNLTAHGGLDYLYKPKIAYEVFMILIHAINSNSHDNLNWFLDIHIINQKVNSDFWIEVESIAKEEGVLDLFNEACYLLRDFGIYAPKPSAFTTTRTNTLLREEAFNNLSFFSKNQIRIKNLIYIINRKYPNKSMIFKIHQFIRYGQFYLSYQRSKNNIKNS